VVNRDQSKARLADCVNALALYGTKRFVLVEGHLEGNLDVMASVELGLKSAVTFNPHFVQILLDLRPALSKSLAEDTLHQVERTELAIIGMPVFLPLFNYSLVNDLNQLAVENQSEVDSQPTLPFAYPMVGHFKLDHLKLRRLAKSDRLFELREMAGIKKTPRKKK